MLTRLFHWLILSLSSALIIYGSQLIILKRGNWTWYSFNRIPGAEKGKTMLSNKIESWLSRRTFFFLPKLAACDNIFLAIETHANVVTSHRIATAMQVLSQMIDSATTALDCKGWQDFPPRSLQFPSRVIWSWDIVVVVIFIQFCFSVLALPFLPLAIFTSCSSCPIL